MAAGSRSKMEPTATFCDRADGGRRLAIELRAYADEQPVVVALPRGGVPVGQAVARALRAPLEVCMVRKLGLPWQPGLQVGAVAQGGFVYLDCEAVDRAGLSHRELTLLTAQEQARVDELARRCAAAMRRDSLLKRTVLLVDDGVESSASLSAAVMAIRAEHPRKVVLALPVASPEVMQALEPKVDRIVALLEPGSAWPVSACYEDFPPVSDDDDAGLLADWAASG
jgi:putative phosphoribosyl transferase